MKCFKLIKTKKNLSFLLLSRKMTGFVLDEREAIDNLYIVHKGHILLYTIGLKLSIRLNFSIFGGITTISKKFSNAT